MNEFLTQYYYLELASYLLNTVKYYCVIIIQLITMLIQLKSIYYIHIWKLIKPDVLLRSYKESCKCLIY